MGRMRYVGKTLMESFIDNIAKPSPFFMTLKGQEPKPRSEEPHREYPETTGRPPDNKCFFDEILAFQMQDVMLWRCESYSKMQRGSYVWITHYVEQPEVGGGHKALRRLGWEAKYRGDHFVWVHPSCKLLPWPVKDHDPHEECE